MWRFALTIALGAFLLFLVQPLIARYILPWFGGGPGVWTVCLLFFQSALLIGYAYAHFINRRFSLRTQAIIHSTGALIALAFLPIIPNQAWKPSGSDDPTLRILLLLSLTIGWPYVIAAATSPLMQAWFSRTHPGVSPYRLFALSNAGSLAALLAYPLVLEPLTTRVTQAWMWSAGFVLFAAASVVCAVNVWCARRDSGTPRADSQADQHAGPANVGSPFSILLWVLLPACASVLLLSFTTRLSEEIAPMPLLWILPLAVYLISFIITFEWPPVYHRAVFLPLLFGSLLLVLILFETQRDGQIIWQVGGALTALFTCCMICHGEVYRLRPDPARLTSFYLAVAFGGALGGAFVAFIAPRLFNFYLEFHLALFATFVLMMVCMWRDSTSWVYRGRRPGVWLSAALVVFFAGYAMHWQHLELHENTAWRARNFFGVLSIKHLQGPDDPAIIAALYHGRIIHGAQVLSPEFRRYRTTYYGQPTGVGLVMRHFRNDQPRRIGAIGLGVGTVAGYLERDDHMRFYDIDPAVAEVAQEVFTYVADARERGADVQVIVGDGRISLERESPQHFDVLILDAFTGDSVPVHLLTREAFEVYRRHMNEGGVILVHVSNLHLSLHLPLLRLAEQMNWHARFLANEDDEARWVYGSHWVLITTNEALAEHPAIQAASEEVSDNLQRITIWTDEHVNLLQILK